MNITMPTLESDRLILRVPRLTDLPFYTAFKTSERARFTGGPITAKQASFNFHGIAGQWLLRGYGLFMAATKADPDTIIGGFGIFHPTTQEEPEFGWTLYDGAHEGKGYVTEAMRVIIPWAWGPMGVDTAQSHIDEGNEASAAVAERLGATLDTAQTEIANAEGGEMFDDPAHVNIWRHHKGGLPA